MKLKHRIPEVDTHTHTVVSGHAWSTLKENVEEAAKKGLKGLCLTEHGPQIPAGGPHFLTYTQIQLPCEIAGVHIYKGVETSILDYEGKLEIKGKYLTYPEFVIASVHPICYTNGTLEQNTQAYLHALRNPYVDILGHAEDARIPADRVSMVQEAQRQGKLIELNNNSLTAHRGYGEQTVVEYMQLCKRMDQRICVGSDAHFYTMVGNVGLAMALLDEIGYPEELIVNLTKERFDAYLEERCARLKEKGDALH